MMLRARCLLLLVPPLLGLPPAHSSPPPDPSALRAELDRIVTASTLDADDQAHRNAVVLVDAPRHSFTYRGAAGIGSVRPTAPMTVEHQFYIESITKTFTATVVLQLAEEGLLGDNGLDASLGELQVFPPEVLDQLHRIDDSSYGAAITVSQLLHHRTGMKNFTYEDEGGTVGDYPGRDFAPNSLLGLFIADPAKGLVGVVEAASKHLPEDTDPTRHIGANGFPSDLDLEPFYFFSPPFEHWDYEAWKQDPKDRFAGLLNFYLSAMNKTARFPPGEEFAYTDTNYLVLGLLVEKITGNSLHSELRRRIFDPLKMDRSYLSYATEPAADRYRKELSELWAVNLPIVRLNLNRSMMWSDAGIVSTVDDLNTFLRALATGKLFRNEATLEAMLALPAGVEMGYGCGIGINRRGDDTILFHSGGAASWMFYYVNADITFIGTMNDAGGEGRQRFAGVQQGFLEALGKQGIRITSPF
jgi:D-alanyl-D-alanine carboxypeptidase